MPLLDVQNLSLHHQQTTLVENISFTLEKGETLALIGESGSGKSLSALSILQLLPSSIHIAAGSSILFKEKNLTSLAHSELRQIRGRDIGIIFQEPMTSLNPLHTIGKQIAEVLMLHTPMPKSQLKERICELLELVQLNILKDRLHAYPHELSGGQRQRMMIAIAIACNPALLIADEPTTALDVSVQAEIMALLQSLQKNLQMGLLFITHNLPLVRTIADNVCVMQHGKIVEQASCKPIFEAPTHPYTQQLLHAHLSGSPVTAQDSKETVLEAENLMVAVPTKRTWFSKPPLKTILSTLSLSLQPGKTLGIVGESGSGKTTLALALCRLIRSTGHILFRKQQLDTISKKELRSLRQHIQFVFQDPFASLNPRMNIEMLISEGLHAHMPSLSKKKRIQKIQDIITEVGLDPAILNRYPHEFSGGQRQRIAIARAVVLEPSLLILDEPTSALDTITQANIIALLKNLQEKYSISMVFISHDLSVIRAISHDVMVLKNGHVVEKGATEEVLLCPQNAYTKALIEHSG